MAILSGCGRQPTAAPLPASPVVVQPTVQASVAPAAEPQATYLSDELPAEPPSPLVVVQSPPPGAHGIALPDPNKLVIAPDSVSSVSRSRAGGGRAKLPFSLVDEAAILADDASQHRPGRPTGPKATIHIFDSPPVAGHSFVFVIDRSASMGAGGLGAIGAAAKELAAQLTSLSADQRVQVVAYNQSSVYFTGRELIPATDENKQKLVKYIGELADYGQTEHERGLVAALRLKPDVIFLLTDGGDPHLRPGQINFLAEQAGGETSIHCVHFGTGTEDAIPADHFLRRLAAETGGSYAFIAVAGKR
ncbi:MAG: VWA domain-containing protein [Planctomycetaceae bacterium]|nr:VWA domain-containing protein [Planctomycetaceae bacterium]